MPKNDNPATKGFVMNAIRNLHNEIKERFNGVENTLDDIDKRFEETEIKAEERHNKVMEQLVDIAGQFQKFDEERFVLAHRQSDHSDRIERLEKAVFKTS